MQIRARTALIHLAISSLVLAGIFAVVYLAWYPAPYFKIRGAERLFGMLALVQLVLGPLMMLLLYKPGKKGLWIDMVVITALQVGALSWGVHTLYQQRPWFMVYAVDRFNVLAAKEVDFSQIRDERFRQKPAREPLLVIANMPLNQAEYERLMFETLMEGKPDLEQRPQYWSDYSQGVEHVLARAKSLAQLREARPGTAAAIDRAVARWELPEEDIVFLPVVGRHADFAVLLEPETGQVLDAIECNPWID